MYRKIWDKCQQSVCAINFYSSRGIRINSVTGFKYGSYILTDDMVYKIAKASEIEIAFLENDGYTIKTKVRITEKDFKQRLVKGVRENLGNFALIIADFPQFDIIPALSLSMSKIAVATPVAILGYSKDNMNLAIKTGIVSSYIKHSNRQYIQFDVAIEFGNSGAPLINAETGEVVGIAGYRLSALTDSYTQMMNILNSNLEILKKSESKINFNDVDPIQVLVTNQHQMKYLAQTLHKNSSVGYGFALEMSQVAECLDLKELDRKVETNPLIKISLQ